MIGVLKWEQSTNACWQSDRCCHGLADRRMRRSEPRAAFSLTAQHGDSFRDRHIAGVPLAIVFGCPGCAEVCPTTLLQMTPHLAALGPDADRIKPVFVCAAPGRSTPLQGLRKYMASFDPRIVQQRQGWLRRGRTHAASHRKIAAGDGYSIDHRTSSPHRTRRRMPFTAGQAHWRG
jgi:hypothetical protein